MLAEYLRTAFLMMRARPIRAALSLLGIFIGVLALVVILSIREGIRHQLNDLYRTEGAQVVFIYPGYDQLLKRIGRLGPDDVELLKLTPGILSATPRLTAELDVQSDGAAVHAHVAGADEKFVALYRIPLVRGRSPLGEEIENKSRVCMLSANMAARLFPSASALGQMITLQGAAYQVVGIVDWTPEINQRTLLSDIDVLVPLGRVPGESHKNYSMIEVRVDPHVVARQAVDLVKTAITRGESGREPLYFVLSLVQSVERHRQFNDKILGALLGIAAISLLVGGIGVANVMVTSVTERTREVGVRKALGARRFDILGQFIVESAVLCVVGGVAAVLVGAVLVYAVPLFVALPTPLVLPAAPVAGCLVLALGIGIVAGGYPASRAAALSPAEALRYE